MLDESWQAKSPIAVFIGVMIVIAILSIGNVNTESAREVVMIAIAISAIMVVLYIFSKFKGGD